MLKELMQSKWLDAHAIVIIATEKLIDQLWKKTLDKYNYKGDKLIEALQRQNQHYNQLIDEYYHLHWFAY